MFCYIFNICCDLFFIKKRLIPIYFKPVENKQLSTGFVDNKISHLKWFCPILVFCSIDELENVN